MELEKFKQKIILRAEQLNHMVDAINDLTKNGQQKGNSFVTPEQFGAVGDGVTDDTEAVQKAFDSGIHIVGDLNRTYRIDGTIQSIVGQGIINKSFIVENCNFYTPSRETSTNLIYICNSTCIEFRNCHFRSDADRTVTGSNGYILSGGKTSNVYFVRTFGRDADAGLAECDVIIDGCTFENAGEVDLYIGNFKPVGDYVTGGTFIVRNCVFTNSFNGFSNRYFKNTIVENTVVRQSEYADTLSHCIYAAIYAKGASVHINGCKLFGTTSYPIHLYHSSEYHLECYNSYIELDYKGDGRVSTIYVGPDSVAKFNGCTIYAPNADLTNGCKDLEFVGCNITVNKHTNVSNHQQEVRNKFIGCEITINKYFSGVGNVFTGCHIIHTGLDSLISNKDIRIENCYIVTYKERDDFSLFSFRGGCEMSNTLIENRAKVPSEIFGVRAEDNYINKCVFKWFNEQRISFPLMEAADCIFVDKYEFFKIYYPDLHNCVVTVEKDGDLIPSGAEVLRKSEVKAFVDNLSEGYTFSHWNKEGDMNNPANFKVLQEDLFIPYLYFNKDGVIAGHDIVSFVKTENTNINLAPGKYKLLGRNAVLSLEGRAVYGTTISQTSPVGDIQVRQDSYDPTLKTYKNGLMYITIIRQPVFGDLVLSFDISNLSYHENGKNDLLWVAGQDKYKEQASVNAYIIDTPEKQHISIVIPHERAYISAIPLNIEGKSFTMSNIMVEYGNIEHDYEEPYNGGTDEGESERDSEMLVPKEGFNQIIEISDNHGLITIDQNIPMFEGLSEYSGNGIAIVPTGSNGLLSRVEVSNAGTYWLTGRNILSSFDGNRGATVNRNENEYIITSPELADENNTSSYVNGSVLMKLPFVPKSGSVFMRMNIEILSTQIENDDNKILLLPAGSTKGQTRIGISDGVLALSFSDVYMAQRSNTYIEMRTHGRNLKVSNVQIGYREEDMFEYEEPRYQKLNIGENLIGNFEEVDGVNVVVQEYTEAEPATITIKRGMA